MSKYGHPPPRIDDMVSLKVDNLTYRTTSEDLRPLFEHYGEVGDIYIPRDHSTRESRGFAFVRFYDKRDAEDALEAMDGIMIDGRELRIQMSRYGPSKPHDRRNSGIADRRSDRQDRNRRSSRERRHSRCRSRSRRSSSRSRSRSRSERKSSRSRSTSYVKKVSVSRSSSKERSAVVIEI